MHGKIKETASHGTLVRHSWVEILGLQDAYLYGQILYWFTPDSMGKSKLRVFKDGDYWVAKTFLEWGQELGIPEATARKVIGRLNEMGLISKATFKFNGSPTTHVKLNWKKHDELEEKWFAEKFPEEYSNLSNDTEEEQPRVTPKPKSTSDFKEEDYAAFLSGWNDNRGELPEAQTLGSSRKKKVTKLFQTLGVDNTLSIIIKATKNVSQDPWWNGENPQRKKYGLDNLLNDDKIISKAETYTAKPNQTKLDKKLSEYEEEQNLGY